MRLVEAEGRNRSRFPADAMFQLDRQEWDNLKSQFTISSWGGARSPPYPLSEQGVPTLSSVLRSSRTIAVNIEIMRAFVRMLGEHADLAARLDRLEKAYDVKFKVVLDAIRQLMIPVSEPRVPERYLPRSARSFG